MSKILCDAKTCINYENGVCKAETIKIVNFEYWIEDSKEYKDIEKCGSYEMDKLWLSK
jgi:hypothetical protein